MFVKNVRGCHVQLPLATGSVDTHIRCRRFVKLTLDAENLLCVIRQHRSDAIKHTRLPKWSIAGPAAVLPHDTLEENWPARRWLRPCPDGLRRSETNDIGE